MAGLNIQGAIDSATNNVESTMQVKNLLAERYQQFNTKQYQTNTAIDWNRVRVEGEIKHDKYITDAEKKERLQRTANTAEEAHKIIKTPKVKSIKDYVNQKERLQETESKMDAVNMSLMTEDPRVPLEEILAMKANKKEDIERVQQAVKDEFDEKIAMGAYDTTHHVSPWFGDLIRHNLNVNYARGQKADEEAKHKYFADERAKQEAADKIKRKSQAKVNIPAGNPTERGMNFD